MKFMKTFVVLVCVIWVADAALADPYSMAIQQAKRVSNQNNAEQQAISQPAPATPTPAPASTPAATPETPAAPNPALEATLKNISNLGADLAAFCNSTNTGADAVPARRDALVNDLNAAAATQKPVAESVQKLADDLINATSGHPKLMSQGSRLGRDLHAVFNSSHLTTSQQYSIVDDVQKILIENGAASVDTSKVLEDLKTIELETK